MLSRYYVTYAAPIFNALSSGSLPSQSHLILHSIPRTHSIFSRAPLHSRIYNPQSGNTQPHHRTSFKTTVNMQHQNFSTQPFPVTSQTPINLLVVDFDDTCTSEDTTAAIIRAAIAATAQAAFDPHQSTTEGERVLQWLVDNYVDRRNSLLKEILPGAYKELFILSPSSSSPPPPPPPSLSHADVIDNFDDFDMSWLGDFIDRLSDFDRDMNIEVVDSNILSGIQRGLLTEKGKSISLRPGCVGTLRHAVHAGIPTAVVSANWSSELVQSALMRHGLKVEIAPGEGGVAAGVQGLIPSPGTILIYANELQYNDHDVSTGNIIRRCECAGDKGRIFDDLLLGIAAEGKNQPRGISIYIGDSMTDLTALISADVGIVLGGNRLIRHVIAASKIPLRPLMGYPIDPGQRTREEDREEGEGMPVLYEANSWGDVGAFLFGIT